MKYKLTRIRTRNIKLSRILRFKRITEFRLEDRTLTIVKDASMQISMDDSRHTREQSPGTAERNERYKKYRN